MISSSPAQFCLALFLISVILSVIVILKVSFLRDAIIANKKLILVLLGIALLSKFPFDSNFFFGLEYEDSYVYNACARHFLYGEHPEIDPFLTKTCYAGSLIECKGLETYSGHLIGLPAVISSLFQVFGYNKYTICTFNLACSLFAMLLVFLLSCRLIPNRGSAFLAALIYATVPIMSVFHTSGLSETFSSTFLLLVHLLYLAKIESPENMRKADSFLCWAALLSSLLFAVLIKRENLTIVFILPVVTLILQSFDGKRVSGYLIKLIPYTAATLFIIIFYISVIKVHETIIVENLDVGGFAFQLNFIGTLLPVFLKALFRLQWFSVFTYLFVCGVCFALWNLRKLRSLLYPLSLFFSYLFLYSSHYRSYYFIKGTPVTEFETLRYLTTVFPFYCLICGVALYGLTEVASRFQGINDRRLIRYCIIPLTALGVGCLIYEGQTVRSAFAEVEREERVIPVTATLETIDSSRSIILTDVPLLFQIFGPEDLFIIDLYQVGKAISEAGLRDFTKTRNVYYLKLPFHEDQIQQARFKTTFEIINTMKKSDASPVRFNAMFKLYLLSN